MAGLQQMESDEELLATLASVKDQLSVLGLKEAIAFDSVNNDFSGLDQLKQKLVRTHIKQG
eukprot:SAG22_NODE_6764_length_814_cov_1.204196_1_plen_61_part_00